MLEVVYEGKTKRVFRADERWVLRFKDTITGDADGNPDPGGNFVVGELDDKAAASAKTAAHFFELLSGAGITTHFLRLRSDTEVEVRPAERVALEVIYRRRAYGSFLSRYGDRVKPMAGLDLVEFCLKDDNLGDPLITPQAAVKFGLASSRELEQMEETTRKAASLIQKNLAERGLELVDMKLEFGKIDGKLVVVDEISGDTMRVYDSKKQSMLNQLELARKLGVA